MCFNPRTHMGCDSLVRKTMLLFSGFNPRTHMGCDPLKLKLAPNSTVSIHAPTWGATVSTLGIDFNKLFQSTHPHGVRPKTLYCSCRCDCFNPRTHMGCDYNGH